MCHEVNDARRQTLPATGPCCDRPAAPDEGTGRTGNARCDPAAMMGAMAEQAAKGGGCPMRAMAKSMLGGVRSGLALLLLIPALLLLGLGVLIFLYPHVLAWLVAGVLVLLGAVIMILALRIRAFLASIRRERAAQA